MLEREDVFSIFQMEILRQVRTGHPLIDAIMFSLLTYFITQMFSSKKHIKNFKKWISRLLSTDNKQIKYVIENRQPQDYEDNKLQVEKNLLYYALAWYLRKHDCITEHADSYKVITNRYGDTGDWDEKITNECVMIPTSQIYITYQDLVIRGEYDYTEDDKGKEIKDRFTLYIDFDLADKMERFLETVLEEHYQYEEMLMTGQKIFSLNVSSYDINKLNWTSNFFRSNTRISNIILHNRLEKDVEKDINIFLQSKDLYNQHGKIWKRGYLFYGPPGTGKTSLVKGIATKTKYNVYNVKLSRFKSDENMEKVLREIPSKSIVLFEDVDCMGDLTHKREGEQVEVTTTTATGTETATTATTPTTTESDAQRKIKPIGERPTLSTLLNFIDGINSPEGIIIIMTTNHVKKLDPALLRDGRIDMRVNLDLCTKQQIIDLAENFLGVTILDSDLQGISDRHLSPATISKILMDLAFHNSKLEIEDKVQTKNSFIKDLLAEYPSRHIDATT